MNFTCELCFYKGGSGWSFPIVCGTRVILESNLAGSSKLSRYLQLSNHLSDNLTEGPIEYVCSEWFWLKGTTTFRPVVRVTRLYWRDSLTMSVFCVARRGCGLLRWPMERTCGRSCKGFEAETLSESATLWYRDAASTRACEWKEPLNCALRRLTEIQRKYRWINKPSHMRRIRANLLHIDPCGSATGQIDTTIPVPLIQLRGILKI